MDLDALAGDVLHWDLLNNLGGPNQAMKSQDGLRKAHVWKN